MSSKLLAFLGLNDSGDVVVESHRKRRTDYMKRIQRLVVPDGENEEAAPAPEHIVTAPDEEMTLPKASGGDEEQGASAVTVEPAPAATAAETGTEMKMAETGADDGPAEAEEREYSRPVPRPQPHSDKKSLASRIFSSLRRPQENDKQLILIRRDSAFLVLDVKQALVDGSSVLIDFAHDDHKTRVGVINDLVNFVRTHGGVFYLLTGTSMLLSLKHDSVVEWRPGEED